MRWLWAIGLLAAGAGLLAAQDKKDDKTAAKIDVTGLQIRKAPPAKPGAFTFTPAGVTMEANVSWPGKYLLGLDPKESKLESFTDDKNNDLAKKPAGFFAGAGDWVMESMMPGGSDGEHFGVQFTAANPPGKGAAKILVKGSLILKCGADEKATDKKKLALKANAEAILGDFRVKVNNAGQFGGQITVFCKEPNVKDVEFYDAKGKAIKVGPPGRGTMPGAGGKMQPTLFYFLSGKMDAVTVKVNYFAKVESVTVPVDVRVGLDLN